VEPVEGDSAVLRCDVRYLTVLRRYCLRTCGIDLERRDESREAEPIQDRGRHQRLAWWARVYGVAGRDAVVIRLGGAGLVEHGEVRMKLVHEQAAVLRGDH